MDGLAAIGEDAEEDKGTHEDQDVNGEEDVVFDHGLFYRSALFTS